MPPVGTLVIAAIVTLVAGTVQGTIGFGSAVLAVPILTMIDPALTPIPQILLSLPLTITMLARERTRIDLRGTAWVLLGRLPGAVIGVALLRVATEKSLSVGIALIVLGAVLAIGRGWQLRRTPPVEVAVGIVSGASGITSGIGGPPLALLYRNAPGATVRSTLSAIFLVGLTINIIALVISDTLTTTDLKIAGVLVGPLLVGVAVSGPLRGRVEGPVLRQGILILAAFAAVGLLATTIWS